MTPSLVTTTKGEKHWRAVTSGVRGHTHKTMGMNFISLSQCMDHSHTSQRCATLYKNRFFMYSGIVLAWDNLKCWDEALLRKLRESTKYRKKCKKKKHGLSANKYIFERKTLRNHFTALGLHTLTLRAAPVFLKNCFGICCLPEQKPLKSNHQIQLAVCYPARDRLCFASEEGVAAQLSPDSNWCSYGPSIMEKENREEKQGGRRKNFRLGPNI